jgi:hypothetical protein
MNEFTEHVMRLEDHIEMKKTPAPSFTGTKSRKTNPDKTQNV